jgi:hypothetical protein
MQFNRMVAQLKRYKVRSSSKSSSAQNKCTATNEVGRVAASSLDPEQLLARVIPLFHEQFGYYFAAIYLLDPSGKWAELKEATGEAAMCSNKPSSSRSTGKEHGRGRDPRKAPRLRRSPPRKTAV